MNMGLVRSDRLFGVLLAVALLCGGTGVFAATGGFKSAASSRSASNSQYGRSSPKPQQPNRSCSRPSKVQRLVFSKTSYPNIRGHFRRAVRKGWPRILVLNRPGASARRERLLERIPTKAGYDRDEYPPAVGRGRGRKALRRGSNPTGWRADVEYIRSAESRSYVSSLGGKLRDFCNGTRFRYAFR